MSYVSDILTKVQEIKTSDGDDKKNAHTKLRSTITGVAIGGVVGLMVGYSKKWNLLYSVIGGAMLGGLASAVLTPNIKE